MHLDLTLAAVICGADEYPEMYFSPELNAATDKLIAAANRNGIILSLFLFGTDRVGEFIDKGFNLIRSAATPVLPSRSFAQRTTTPTAWLLSSRLCKLLTWRWICACCSIGNDLHHLLTQATAHVGALVDIAKEHGKDWQPTSYSTGIIALE